MRPLRTDASNAATVSGSNAGGGFALAAVLRAQAATMIAMADQLEAGIASAPAAVEPPTLVPLSEVAKRLGCSLPTARVTLERAGVRGVLVGDHRRFDLVEVTDALRRAG